MKKGILIAFGIIVGLIILGSIFGEDTTIDTAQSTDTTDQITAIKSDQEYSLKVLEAAISKDYEGDDIIIVTYEFTHTKDDATSFSIAFDDCLYQNGIGLNKSYFVDDDSYDSDSQYKEIKSGATLEVQVAYELEDSTTQIDVEVAELFSFSDELILETVINI